MPICQKCEVKFPWNIVVNGVKKHLSNRKYCLTCSPFKQHNTISLERHRKLCTVDTKSKLPQEKQCEDCKAMLSITDFGVHRRKGNRSDELYIFPICKKCDSKRHRLRKRELKEKSVEYKGGKCIYCGYDKCLRSLDFHHRDPKEKDFPISSFWSSFNEVVKEELDKCDLVCSNCHGEIHEEIDNMQH